MLEPLEPRHAAEMVDVLADPALYRFTGGSPPSEAELRGRYERQAVGRSPDGSALWLNWIVRERASRRAVGYVQATVGVESRVAELAWVVGTDFQGRGFAREAAGAAAASLFDAGAAGLRAHIRPEHAASEAVARAIGLAPTETVVDGEVRWELAAG